jgi:hypothetical protein
VKVPEGTEAENGLAEIAPVAARVPDMRTLSPSRVLLAALALLTVLAINLIGPARADAAIAAGAEANGELINPDVTPARQAAVLDKLDAQGVSIIRANVQWVNIARSCGGQSSTQLRSDANACYDWALIDGLVSGAEARGMQLLFSVSGAPRWLHGTSNTAFVGGTATQWRRTMDHYPAFMAAIASRYDFSSKIGTVRYWTIWNEPNSKTFWSPMFSTSQRAIAPARYAALYGKAAPAMKAVSPRAVIAPGPTGPNSSPWKPAAYIRELQRLLPTYLPGTTMAQKRSYIGAWAHNPYPNSYYGPKGNPRTGRSYTHRDSLGIAQIDDLVRLLDSSSLTRGKNIWATEFAWETNPPDDFFGITPTQQGRYLAEAFDVLDRTGRVNIGVWYGLTDPPDDAQDFHSGTYFNSGRPKPSLASYRLVISASATSVRRGQSVQLYARANTNRRATRIMYSADNRTWRLLPLKGRRSDGSIRTSVRMTRKLYFSTWDGTQRGQTRVVGVR